MAVPLNTFGQPISQAGGSIVPDGNAPSVNPAPNVPPMSIPLGGGYGQMGSQTKPATLINRPVLTPSPYVSPGNNVTAPRSQEDIYSAYVKQGQSVLDQINSVYDNAIKQSNIAIDTPAATAQENQNAMAAASGLLGSSSAIGGSTRIAAKAGADKAAATSEILGKKAGDVAKYLQTLQSAAQQQSNFETQQYPTTDAYLKSQAGQAFQGLAASGVDWDKLTSVPEYQDVYKSIVQAYGGNEGLAKLGFIAASKTDSQSAYLNQDPIQDSNGNWIFFKSTTDAQGNTKVVPDIVNIGSALGPGQSLTTLGGKPYAITKAADGTLTYKPIDTTGGGFTLSKDQTRYELNPTTGKYEVVGKGLASGGGGSISVDSTTKPYVDAFNNAIAALGPQKSTQASQTFKQYMDAGDLEGAKTYIVRVALSGAPADQQNQAIGRTQALAAMNDIKDLLKQAKDNGVNTNILLGSLINVGNNLGASPNTDLSYIGSRILQSLITYRKGMTGVAFGPQEAADYQKIFPDITNIDSLNSAKIKALQDSLNANNRAALSFYVGGDDNYNKLFGPSATNTLPSNKEGDYIKAENAAPGSDILIDGVKYHKNEDGTFDEI